MKHKIDRSEWYEALTPKGKSYLNLYEETLTEAIEIVKRHQKEQAQARAVKHKPSRWFIVKAQLARVFNSNGEFLRCSERKDVVAVVNENGTVSLVEDNIVFKEK